MTTIIDRAPNPNAAKLFIDFVLSEEGQRLFASRGRGPARPGIARMVTRVISK